MSAGYYDNEDHHGYGVVRCWWLRWHSSCRPGCYVLTTIWGPRNCVAVVDDFGTLVEVPS